MENKMCEWKMCTEKAKAVENYNGMLYSVCTYHKRVINKQKKADHKYEDDQE